MTNVPGVGAAGGSAVGQEVPSCARRGCAQPRTRPALHTQLPDGHSGARFIPEWFSLFGNLIAIYF